MKTQRIFQTIVCLIIVTSLVACGSAAQSEVQTSESIANHSQSENASAALDTNGSSGDALLIDPSEAVANQYERPQGWQEATHSKTARPDYDVVFPQDEVKRMDIVIEPEYWQAMLDDMTDKYGIFGAGNDRKPGGGDAVGQGPVEGIQPPAQEARPPMGGGKFADNPIWVPVTVLFEGNTWYYVGVRFKGNSSLRSSWTSGVMKIPLRLDFDEFEDSVPQIDDQRFYGFKQLSLSNNFKDESFLHEKLAADLFREAGVPAAHTAFYEVYLDYGEGPVYFGLYTMVEVVENTVIKEQFEESSGNLYKPEGQAGSFAVGNFNTEVFAKETNQDEADWSDIQALFDCLHDPIRSTDPAAWRAELESIFDVDGFLNWLAVNTTIQNWDTYGVMFHNYYLYHDPDTDLLTWIPWDNNEAFYSGGRLNPPLSVSLSEVTERWPLIRFLIDDDLYRSQYDAYLLEFTTNVFDPQKMAETYEYYHDLVRASVLAELEGYSYLSSDVAFERSLKILIDHATQRNEAVKDYLAQ